MSTIHGGPGADLLIGDIDVEDPGDDILGAGGADTLVGGFEADTLDGGAGIDTVDYGVATAAFGPPAAGVVVNLAGGTATDGWGFQDLLSSIENVKEPSWMTSSQETSTTTCRPEGRAMTLSSAVMATTRSLAATATISSDGAPAMASIPILGQAAPIR